MWLMKEFADAKQQQADFAEAERLFHESLALTESIPQDAARINWISNLTCCLSDCLVKQGKTSEAEMYQKVVVLGDRDWALAPSPSCRSWPAITLWNESIATSVFHVG